MTVKPTNIALALLTVLVGALLVSVFALGISGIRTAEGLSILIAALAVLGALLVEPYRRVGV